jgi:hypothetical protein
MPRIMPVCCLKRAYIQSRLALRTLQEVRRFCRQRVTRIERGGSNAHIGRASEENNCVSKQSTRGYLRSPNLMVRVSAGALIHLLDRVPRGAAVRSLDEHIVRGLEPASKPKKSERAKASRP